MNEYAIMRVELN